MIDRKDRKQEGKHDWSVDCDPEKNILGSYRYGTFSVGIFQWINAKSYKGLKKSQVKYRIKGETSYPDTVYRRAEKVCDWMDIGEWSHKNKSETVKP
jgi:hypothetical protein